METDISVLLPEVKYEKACAVIRLIGEVNNQSIFALCDEIDLAIEYYNYKKIDIQIDSPGGAITSLDYYLSKLHKWQQRYGVIIGTLGLTKIASSAAMILSLGTIGYRRAYQSSQLVYHNSRIITSKAEVWTKERLDYTNKSLAETDGRLITRLVKHIHSNKVIEKGQVKYKRMHGIDFDFENKLYRLKQTPEEEVLSEQTLKQEYVKLSNLDTVITPLLAHQMLLIDSTQEEFEESGLEKLFKEE
ncbi:MAG: ATP-dependent Clp protease proteolytic subunit [Bacteroidetes bacterium]|nr:ATP-dependent Clp protease proteolytic subunit [Bacteroidota bacterium]